MGIMIKLLIFLAVYGYMGYKAFDACFDHLLDTHKEHFSALRVEGYMTEYFFFSLMAAIFWFVYLPYNKFKLTIFSDYVDKKINPEKEAERKLWKS